MKPTRYEALRQAVGEVLEVTDEDWEQIDEQVENIRTRYP